MPAMPPRSPFRLACRWLLVLAMLPVTVAVQAADQGATPDARIDALMQRYAGDVPGASVLVIRDGRPVFRRSYGMAELETRRASTPAASLNSLTWDRACVLNAASLANSL